MDCGEEGVYFVVGGVFEIIDNFGYLAHGFDTDNALES